MMTATARAVGLCLLRSCSFMPEYYSKAAKRGHGDTAASAAAVATTLPAPTAIAAPVVLSPDMFSPEVLRQMYSILSGEGKPPPPIAEAMAVPPAPVRSSKIPAEIDVNAAKQTQNDEFYTPKNENEDE